MKVKINMKKINLVSLFILLVCTMSLRAEAEQDLATLFPYLHSLCITEGYGSENHFDPGLHNTVIYHFHLQDTLTIHDKLYGKMGNNCFLREEGKKIWIYDDFSSKEFLLYDFGLEVGDSLPCIFNLNGYELTYDNILPEYYPDTIVVTAIKERTLDNGKTYKEWVFDYGDSHVEGLGCMHRGFLKGRIWEPIPTCDPEVHLKICASVNGEQLYIDQNYIQEYQVSCKCDDSLPSDIESVKTETLIRVSGRVLHIGKAMGAKFTLTDITGKQVMQFMADSDEMQVDVSGLHSGIYILTGKDISQKIAIF